MFGAFGKTKDPKKEPSSSQESCEHLNGSLHSMPHSIHSSNVWSKKLSLGQLIHQKTIDHLMSPKVFVKEGQRQCIVQKSIQMSHVTHYTVLYVANPNIRDAYFVTAGAKMKIPAEAIVFLTLGRWEKGVRLVRKPSLLPSRQGENSWRLVGKTS